MHGIPVLLTSIFLSSTYSVFYKVLLTVGLAQVTQRNKQISYAGACEVHKLEPLLFVLAVAKIKVS